MDRKELWDNVYASKAPTEVSWFEDEPRVSLALIEMVSSAGDRVVDVGGGASTLVDRLIDRGFDKVAVVDVADRALTVARRRLGDRAALVTWIRGDVTSLDHFGQFDVWHDRAAFHFLTDAQERRRYVELAERTVPRGGHLLVGTFALDGPPQCSNLDVCRYDAARLADEFGAAFDLIHQRSHIHTTPWGKPQPFLFGVFRRC